MSDETIDIERYILLNAPTLDIDYIEDIAVKSIDDYIRPAHTKMAHDYALSGLKEAAKKDYRLQRILKSFDRRSSRISMHKWEWKRLLRLFEFQITTQNRIWMGLYGDPGTGKSMVAIFLMLSILASFDAYDDGDHPVLGFARSPSDLNDLFTEVLELAKTVIVSYDESEEEGGQGSRKEHRALLQTARTNRMYRHSVIMCSIKRKDFGSLIDFCDILVRTIFKDMENKVNWCLLYTKKFDTNTWIPEAIFGVPFNLPPDLLDTYLEWKTEMQRQMTEQGGLLSPSDIKQKQVLNRLLIHVDEHGYESYSIRKLEQLLRDKDTKIGGEVLVLSQQSDVAIKAYRLLGDMKKPPSTPSGSTSYIGQTEDMRHAILSRMIERGCDPIHVKALEIRVFQNVSQDVVALVLKEKEITDVKQATVSNWLREGGFVAQMGYAFENIYSRYLTVQGISHVAGGGNKEIPDIVLFDADNRPSRVISLKCLNDSRDVTSINRDKFAKKELALAKEHNIPLEMVYFDMWKGHLHPPQLDEGQETFTFRRPEVLK